MNHAFKSSLYLFIPEVMRAVISSDDGGELLPDAEVSGFPGYRFSPFYKPACYAGNCTLLCCFSRKRVQIYVGGQIKTGLNRCLYYGGDFYQWHIIFRNSEL